MAFQFPAAPTVGQIFTPIAGLSYKWDGELWVPLSPPLTSTVALPSQNLAGLPEVIFNIPPNARAIEVPFVSVESGGVNGLFMTLGTAGGFGGGTYGGCSGFMDGPATSSVAMASTAWGYGTGVLTHGLTRIERMGSSDTWAMSYTLANPVGGQMRFGAGVATIPGAVTQLKCACTAGNFVGGSISATVYF